MASIESRIAALPLWAPAVSECTNNDCQMVKVQLPDVIKDSIVVATDHGELVISGMAASRRYYRRLPLHYQATPGTIQTELHNGILEVRVPNPQAH